MVVASFALREDYWEEFELQDEDVEFIYNHLLDVETPLTPDELITVLVEERIKRELREIEEQRLAGGDIYLPKDAHSLDQELVFPALGWQKGKVVATREGWNPESGDFNVVRVKLDDSDEREFASGLEQHALNDPPDLAGEDTPTVEDILASWKDHLIGRLEDGLIANDGFVRIAGKWFPRALLVDVNTGHLNLAEAVLDMEGGGPLPTTDLVDQVDLPKDENQNLVVFSLDLALQEDDRFDEVGPAGQVLWYLKRLEPDGVQETPLWLQYKEVDHDRALLSPEMVDLEKTIDDELSPLGDAQVPGNDVTLSLLYPHLRAGTLPLSHRVQPFFPTAYEAPRIRFILVDGDTKEKFPGWVVREGKYVFGLSDWYRERELMPGSIIRIRKGKNPGEVVIQAETQRSRRDWVRTALVGTDGGIVFAMLKQVVAAAYDERMAVMVPDLDVLDGVWEERSKKQVPFERVVVDIVRELTKLNPQSHVHASALYAAVNLVRRCPPAPILALLASRPWFVHVGDLHFRFDDSAGK